VEKPDQQRFFMTDAHARSMKKPGSDWGGEAGIQKIE
jgi:hypothetical protein